MIGILRLVEAPAPDAIERAFANRVRRLEDLAVREVLAKLEATRRDLAGELAGTEWDRFMIPRLRRSVDQAIARWREEYSDILGRTNAEAWVTGENALPELVADQVGKRVTFPALDPGVLTMAQDATGDLITDITTSARTKIMSEIQRGLMGDRPLSDVMRRVGRNLDDPSVFQSIADRAEVITRTETNRVYNLANHERDQQFGDMSDDLGLVVTKVWVATPGPRTRDAHRAANGQEVPLDEPFIVGGERLMHPLDPGASAANTVNCRCRMKRRFEKRKAA